MSRPGSKLESEHAAGPSAELAVVVPGPRKTQRLRGAKGRFVPVKVPASSEAAKPQADRPLRPAPRPGGCPQFVRREIADALPEICRVLVQRALKGEAAALRMLWQMALLDKPGEAKRGNGTASGDKGFARKLLAEFRR